MILPSKAVGGGHHPGAVDQHAPTHESPVQLQVDQPRPAARGGWRTADDSGAWLRQVLHNGHALPTHRYREDEMGKERERHRQSEGGVG